MALFDDFTKKAAKFTEDAIDKTQEFAGTTKIKLKIKNIESERDDVYRELGRHYYHLIKDENSVVDLVYDLRQKVDDNETQIMALRAEIEDLQE